MVPQEQPKVPVLFAAGRFANDGSVISSHNLTSDHYSTGRYNLFFEKQPKDAKYLVNVFTHGDADASTCSSEYDYCLNQERFQVTINQADDAKTPMNREFSVFVYVMPE